MADPRFPIGTPRDLQLKLLDIECVEPALGGNSTHHTEKEFLRIPFV